VTLVSIVTPTMPGRERLLLERCIPSVAALDWPDVEHVIVSDRAPGLAGKLAGHPGVRLAELNETWRDGVRDASVGAFPWYVGSLLALGEFVGWLGDDDELLPDHVARHVAAMEATGAAWSLSRVQFVVRGQPRFIIGDPSYAHGHLDSDGVMCRAETMRTATWDPRGRPGDSADVVNAGDYRLVRAWREAGLPGVFVDGDPTAVHHDGWAANR
jgi:glycosyltransferase involved in cell wall biosynthesis